MTRRDARATRDAALLGCVLVALVLSLASRAQASVVRFAVVVGNDLGLEHEAELRYAESDARRLHDSLRDIGDFEPINITLLEGRDAETLRRTSTRAADAAFQIYLLTMADTAQQKQLTPALSGRVALGAGQHF